MSFTDLIITGCLALSTPAPDTDVASAPMSLEREVAALTEGRLYGDAIGRIEATLAANPESPVALRLLGEATQAGYGVDPNDEDAIALYRRAANLGDPIARYRLGRAYEIGQGIAQSTGSALTQYELAAPANPDAALRYAEIALANAQTTGFTPKHNPVELLEYAATNGLDRARFILGTLLVKGEGIAKDEERASALFEEAATTEAEALSALGTLRHKNKDYKAAIEYFKRAREEGDATGSAYLGYYAEHGIDRPNNREAALQLYREAPDVQWAKAGIERIRAHNASLDLFGMPVYGTTRKEVVALFKEKEAKVLGGEPHFDAYDVTKLVGGRPAILTVGFAPGGPEYAAEFNYAFRSTHKTRKETVDELEQTLTKRYGKWKNRKSSGGNTRMWWTVDNVLIHLRHQRDSHAVNVTYQVQPFAKKLAQYTATLHQNKEQGLTDAL